MKKPAIFMDAYLTDESRHEIFNYNVSQFIKHDWDVFIFSNKINHFDSFHGVKYFEYDSTNRVLLDRNRYELISGLHAYATVYDANGTEYQFDTTVQSHGFTNWTLLHNLRKMAVIAKRFGHTHFITCEYDIRFKDYNLLNSTFKGFGDTEKSKQCMIVKYGGYGCLTNLYLIGVDLVLSLIPEMETEDDYETFLCTLYDGPMSPIYEQLFWEKIVQYTDTDGAKNAEIIPYDQFISNIEEWGVHMSEGDLGLRQGIFYKSLVVTPINNNTEFFIKYWTEGHHDILVEYTTNLETQYHILRPDQWLTIPCVGRQYVHIRTSESLVHSNTPLVFNLHDTYRSTLTKTNK